MNQISLQRNRVRVEKKTRTRLRVLREDAQANAGWAVSSAMKRWKGLITLAVSRQIYTANMRIKIKYLGEFFDATTSLCT